jgi:conjugal transfer pilus assembly protein TraB
MFDDLRQDWQDTNPKVRWAFIGAGVIGMTLIGAHHLLKQAPAADAMATQDEAPATNAGSVPGAADAQAFHQRSALPSSQRNQGLEDMELKLQTLNDKLDRQTKELDTLRAANGANATGVQAGVPMSVSRPAPSAPSSQAGSVDLDSMLPGPTFPEGSPGKANARDGARSNGLLNGLDGDASAAEPAPAHMKIWAEDGAAESASLTTVAGAEHDETFVVPVNAALEGVLLSGFNARPTGAVAGAVGNNAQTSANEVGAPFVSRLKGEAILPNGWRLADLGDCFLGGSGVAVLAAERAYVISSELSCVAPNGDVWEAPIKAYGLDVDGTLGLAGKVVSKQGSLLMQAALTGVVAGLGTMLSPTSIPAYNVTATGGGTTGYQYPNIGALAATALGQGVNSASQQLSHFYLQYATEVFPVVEVVSGTRVTWVVRESVTLHRRTGAAKLQGAKL